jgi:hypothetical protein
LIAAFIVFDKLVRLEYSAHRRDWEADGKPHAFFWVPREVRSGGWLIQFGSSVARMRKSYVWVFSTPEWVRKDKNARHLLYWLRILVISWNLGLISAVLGNFLT